MTGGRHIGCVALLVCLTALAGCVSAPRGTTGARPLAPPAAAGERLVSQVVRGVAGSRHITLRCVVTVQDGAMSVVGLNALGLRLFTLSYDGAEVSVERATHIPEELTPERLLADLQLVYWPLAPLRETLRTVGLDVTEFAHGTRQLRHGSRLLAEVSYAGEDAWNGTARLVSHEFGYSLQIDSQPL